MVKRIGEKVVNEFKVEEYRFFCNPFRKSYGLNLAYELMMSKKLDDKVLRSDKFLKDMDAKYILEKYPTKQSFIDAFTGSGLSWEMTSIYRGVETRFTGSDSGKKITLSYSSDSSIGIWDVFFYLDKAAKEK